MRRLFELCSVFNFNIDITAPECLVPNLDYEVKWVFIMILPLGALALLVCLYLAKIVRSSARSSCCKTLGTQMSSIIALYSMIFYYLYLAVTRRALDIFNCNPSIPADGYLYTEFTSITCEGGLCKCWLPDSLQLKLVPWSAIFLIAYTLVYPAYIAWVVLLKSNRKIVVEDQIMRAHELQDLKSTNKETHDFRKRYHKLYYHFKPQKAHWMLVILLRKLGIAVAGLMLRANPSFQLAVCLCILFVCYVLQVKHRPFMSTSERT